MTEPRWPYSVETIGTNQKWFEVMDVPKATITDARKWLRAQGHRWTLRRLWRIVDRNGRPVKAFFPKEGDE